jgi:hypothetical protein
MEVQRSPVAATLKPRWALTPAGGVDVLALALLAIGLCALFLPTLVEVARTIWTRDEQGHGPIILAVTAWLVYRKRDELFALAPNPRPVAGSLWLALGLLMFVLGRSQASHYILAFAIMAYAM